MLQRRFMEIALVLAFWPLVITTLYNYGYIGWTILPQSAYALAASAIVYIILSHILTFVHMRCKMWEANKKVEYQSKMGSIRLAKDIEKKQKELQKQIAKEEKHGLTISNVAKQAVGTITTKDHVIVPVHYGSRRWAPQPPVTEIV